MNISREYSINKSYWNEVYNFGGSDVNDDFLLVTTIHLLTLFFVCRWVSRHNVGWSSFFFTGWLYMAEFILITFISSDERFFFLEHLIYFYFFISIGIIIYFYSFFFRMMIMAFYTFSKYTHYWFKSILDELNYFFLYHFFVKNRYEYINFSMSSFFSKSLYFKYKNFYTSINSKFLQFSLNTGFIYFIYLLSFSYCIIIIYSIYHHFSNIGFWFDRSSYDLFVIINSDCFILLIHLYYYFFFKLIINSIGFNQIISFNFLRLVNFSKQLEITDDLMDWEPSYFETIVINEEFSPEDTSIYLMDSLFGDYEELIGIYESFLDLETIEVNYRFHIPAEWLNYKTYVIDSYDNNIFQYINMTLDNILDYLWAELVEYEALNHFFIEYDLTLKI